MSDSRSRPRRWDCYVQDMLGACEKIMAYTNGLDQPTFVADERTYDATLRNLGLIGEAATCVPKAIRESHDEVPWRAMIATRNRIIHAYLGIDDDVIWSIIRDDVPNVAPLLRALLDESLAEGPADDD